MSRHGAGGDHAEGRPAAAEPHHVRDLLRFATAGSVDDGKSTLVGRLLYDTKSVLADQIEAVQRASVDKGLATPGPVAAGRRPARRARAGHHDRRRVPVLLDAHGASSCSPTRPGHVQYTRNTVTGASTAELAVLLVDARNGIVEQTRRHAAVLALLRVPRLVLAINKIDLVGLRRGDAHRDRQGLRRAGPVAGLPGRRRRHDPGLGAGRRQRRRALASAPPGTTGRRCSGTWSRCRSPGPEVDAPFRMPVQYVIRPRRNAAGTDELHDYRGYAGQVASGTVAPGRRGGGAARRPPDHGRRGRHRRRAAGRRPARAAA